MLSRYRCRKCFRNHIVRNGRKPKRQDVHWVWRCFRHARGSFIYYLSPCKIIRLSTKWIPPFRSPLLSYQSWISHPKAGQVLFFFTRSEDVLHRKHGGLTKGGGLFTFCLLPGCDLLISRREHRDALSDDEWKNTRQI